MLYNHFRQISGFCNKNSNIFVLTRILADLTTNFVKNTLVQFEKNFDIIIESKGLLHSRANMGNVRLNGKT